MRTLLIATKNAHKTQEIQAILGQDWEVTDLVAHPEIAAPEETGETFAENAAIKALAAAERFSGWVMADDSGLEVDALGGAPGVYSARYAGLEATDAENRAKLLSALEGLALEQRKGRFRCVLAIARGGEVLGTFSGAVEGTILTEEHGEGGFGYDSLFAPEGLEQTFGELSAAAKNQLSHRGRALAEAAKFLATLPE